MVLDTLKTILDEADIDFGVFRMGTVMALIQAIASRYTVQFFGFITTLKEHQQKIRELMLLEAMEILFKKLMLFSLFRKLNIVNIQMLFAAKYRTYGVNQLEILI